MASTAFPKLTKSLSDVKTAFTSVGGNLPGLISATKTGVSGLWSLIKAHPFVAVTAGITAASIAIQAYQKRQEDYQNSLRKAISASDENIQKYNNEKTSLTSLQSKLEDAKNDKAKLLSIQNELNNSIGKTPGLVSGEGNAYEVANEKIKARIKELDELAKKEAEAKIKNQKEIFKSHKTPTDFSPNQFFFDEISHGVDIDLNEALKSYNIWKANLKASESLVEHWDGKSGSRYERMKKNSEELVHEAEDRIGRYKDIIEGKISEAKEVLSDYIGTQFDNDVDKSFINQYISDLIYGGETDLDSIQNKIDKFKPTLDKFNQLKNDLISNSIEGKNTDNIANDIQSIIDQVSKTAPELGNLLQSSLDSIISDEGEIKNKAETITKITAESVKTATDGIKKVQEILSGQSTGNSLSVEDFNSAELKDYTSALENHNGVLQLNKEKVQELIEAETEAKLATIAASKAQTQSEYLKKAGEIETLRQKIKDKNYAEGETEELIKNNINTLLSENEALLKECDAYDLMSNSLKEATDAYHNWLNAQNASQSGDMFDDTLNAINRINETLNKSDSDYYGRVGRTDYQAALKLIIPENVDSEDEAKVKAYLKSIYSMFTYDDDGNRAGLNIENFCKQAVAKGLMVFDKASEEYKIAGQKTMDDFAEGLNLSLPLVQAMFGEMEEFGGDFSWADEANKTIGDLGVAADVAAEKLRALHSDQTINLDISNLETTAEKTDSLKNTIKQMQGYISLDSTQAEYARDVIHYCVAEMQQLEDPAILKVDASKVSEVSKSAGDAVKLLQDYKTAYNELETAKQLKVDTSEAQQKVDSLLGKISSTDNKYLLSLGLDTTSVASLNSAITNLNLEKIKTTFKIDDSVLKEYSPDDKKATVTYKKNSTEVDNYNPKNLSRTVTYWVHTAGKIDNPKVGYDQLNGSANAGGNWGTKRGGRTLTGELGREIVVNPHTGRWYTVGDNGAEFVNIPKGSIVFNHKQTEALLKNGYVAGRATALVGGTAMVTGGIKKSAAKKSTKSGGNSTSKSSSKKTSSKSSTKSSKSSSKSEEKEPEAFDWIEIALERIQRAITNLSKKAENTFKKLSTRLKATNDEISKINQEINIQQQASDRYLKQANSVGLSSSLAKKVRDGSIDINKYNEDTRKLIDEYKKWYEQSLKCKDAIADLHEELAKLYKDNFDKVKSDYDNQLALYEHLTNTYNNGIDELEESGYLASKEYYSALQKVEKQNIRIMENELSDLEKAFAEAMASGEIDEYSEEWYEFQKTMNGVKEEIQESNTELIKLSKTMRTIDWDRFEYLQDRVSQLTTESDFMIKLMDSSQLYDEQGQLTNQGMATLGLHGQNYNVYMNQADKYAKELQNISKEIAENPYDTELIKRREELLELQRDAILAAEDEKQAIIDLVEEGINTELSSLKELIDNYNEALDSAKDLYNYQKRIDEQTSKVSSLRKQISAYSGDDSEENQARLQNLRNQLKSAESDLQETEYDKYVSDQKKLLDNFYTEYETILNKRMDDIDGTINNMIDVINDNSSEINDTLNEVGDNVGYTLTDEMSKIWDNSTNSINGVITQYGDSFSEKLTSVNMVISSIQSSVSKLAGESEKKATTTVSKTTKTTTPKKTTTTTAKKTTTTTTSKKTTTSSGGDGKAKVGDKVTFASGKYYSSSDGIAPLGNKNLNKSVYITKINTASWAKYPYHISTGTKLGKGDLGWVKLNQLKGYKHGGVVDYTGLAMLHGSPQNPETVLNAEQTKSLDKLSNYLSEMSKVPIVSSKIPYGNMTGSDILYNLLDVSNMVSSVRNFSKKSNDSNGDIYFNIAIDKVEDYNDFVTKIQKDKKFALMMRDETINLVNGGSKFAKNKYKWQ